MPNAPKPRTRRKARRTPEYSEEGRAARVERGQADAAAALERLCSGADSERLQRWHLGGGVVGLGIGYKRVQGVPTRDLALRVYVARKRPESAVPRACRVPRHVVADGIEKPIPTDIIESSELRVSGLSERNRPVFHGLSIGHCASGETGTLGAILKDAEGAPVILSAAHVLAASGVAKVGDAIVQPGGVSGGSCPSDTVASLRAWTPLQAGTTFPNRADLAIARLTGADPDVGARPIVRLGTREDVTLAHGLVWRLGCMTGETPTVIDDMDYVGALRYPTEPGAPVFGFRGLLRYSAHGIAGDSGGPLLTPEGVLLGIHLGQTDDGWGVATPVWSIPAAWGLTISSSGGE